MNILVTGAAGFLGRHFEAALREAGHDVFGVDIAPRGGDAPLDALDLFRRDATHWDLVVHCAAVAPHRAAIDAAPLAVGSGCLQLDAALFEWAARTRPGRVVYLSSCAAYAPRSHADSPMREDDVAATTGSGVDVYGWVKLTGERLAAAYAAQGGAVTVVRPFSGYGTDQSERFPFRAFVDRARRRADPFKVWGSGQQVRDWVHVDDVVAATLAAVEHGVIGPVNIGTGRGVCMDLLAAMVCEQVGYRPEIVHDDDAPAGVPYRVADTTLLDRIYRPRVTLEEGIRRALAS